jgi:hypothetical protein
VFNVPQRYVPVMLISVGISATPSRASGRLPIDHVVVMNTL